MCIDISIHMCTHMPVHMLTPVCTHVHTCMNYTHYHGDYAFSTATADINIPAPVVLKLEVVIGTRLYMFLHTCPCLCHNAVHQLDVVDDAIQVLEGTCSPPILECHGMASWSVQHPSS